MIPAVVLGLLESRLNQQLHDQPELLQRCRALQGRCIEVELTDVNQQLYCYPGDWGLHLSQRNQQSVDASIRGRSMALLNLSLEDDKISTSIKEGVQFQGEVGVAQQLQKIFMGLEFDLEHQLAQWLGDPLAYLIHNGLQQGKSWARHNADAISRSSVEYLQQEAQLSPTSTELEEFSRAVQQCRNAVDRTEARLQRLLRKVPV